MHPGPLPYAHMVMRTYVIKIALRCLASVGQFALTPYWRGWDEIISAAVLLGATIWIVGLLWSTFRRAHRAAANQRPEERQ